MEFSEWLRLNLNENNWSQAQIARRSRISEGHISRLLAGLAKPGEDAAKAIAHAFHFSEEEGLRVAGILPEINKSTRIAEKKAVYKLSLLDDDKLEIANRLLDALLEPEGIKTPLSKSREVQKPPESSVYQYKK